MLEPSSVNFVIYHGNCSDGFGASYAAQKLLGNRATYYAARHDDPPPDVTGKVVAILDFSYDLETTKRLIEQAEDLIVIDHHQSALIELSELSKYTRFDMTHSGCILSWNFFHPGKEPPKFLMYIEDRDLWKWEFPYSREFSKAFDMVPFDFDEYDQFCDESVVDDAMKRGAYILAYSRTVLNKIAADATDRYMKGSLYHAKVLNSCHLMSELGNILAMDSDFGLVWFYDHKDKMNLVSLRAFHDDIDVSEIAKKHGGGGHRKAAGFRFKGNIENLFSKKKYVPKEVDPPAPEEGEEE